MLILSYHLNACLSICQFSLCLLCIHLGPQSHPCGMVMADRERRRETEGDEDERARERGPSVLMKIFLVLS